MADQLPGGRPVAPGELGRVRRNHKKKEKDRKRTASAAEAGETNSYGGGKGADGAGHGDRPRGGNYRPSGGGPPMAKRRKKTRTEQAKNRRRRYVEDLSSVPIPPADNPGRHYTISLAIPGSIVDNAQSPELKAYLAGQIARAAVVYQIDEVIVFSENSNRGDIRGNAADADGDLYLARILQYLETPPYLRKALIPIDRGLRFAGLLNPLLTPHHMRMDDWVPYREAVVLDTPAGRSGGSLVNAGMRKMVRVDKRIQAGVRVTVALGEAREVAQTRKGYRGKVVAPTLPRTERGLYWGYTTRVATTLSAVFDECPYEGGYDVKIGTSERGDNVFGDDFELPPFSHALIVLGGVHGLEESLSSDFALSATVHDPRELFDVYLNVCPDQGSGTIRTEEAALIVMSALYPHIKTAGRSQ